MKYPRCSLRNLAWAQAPSIIYGFPPSRPFDCQASIYEYVDEEENTMSRTTQLNDEDINIGRNTEVFNVAVNRMQNSGVYVPKLPNHCLIQRWVSGFVWLGFSMKTRMDSHQNHWAIIEQVQFIFYIWYSCRTHALLAVYNMKHLLNYLLMPTPD